MQQHNHGLLKIILLCLMYNVNGSTKQDLIEHSKELTRKLKERLEIHKCYIKHPYVKTYGRWYRFNCEEISKDIIDNYETWTQTKKNYARMGTIITIRSIKSKHFYRLFEFENKVIASIINYAEHNKSNVDSDDLSVSFDYVSLSNIVDYAMIGSTIADIKKIRNFSNNLLIENAAEITIAVCKLRIFQKMKQCLSDLVDDKLNQKYTGEKFTAKVDEWFYNITNNSDPIDFDEINYYEKTWIFFGKDAIYDTFCKGVLDYERSLSTKYFSNKPKLMFDFIFNLISNVQKDAFNLYWRAAFYFAVENDEIGAAVQTAYGNFIDFASKQMFEFFRANYRVVDTRSVGLHVKKTYIDSLSQNKGFIMRFEAFFAAFRLDYAMKELQKNDQTANIIEEFRKFTDDNTSTIFLLDPINMKNIDALFRIFRDATIIQSAHDYSHYLSYIEELIGKDASNSKQEVEKMRDGLCKAADNSRSVATQVPNTFVKGLQNEAADQLENFNTQSGEAYNSNKNISSTMQNYYDVPNPYNITITEYKEVTGEPQLIRLISELEKICLSNANNQLVSKQRITVSNSFETNDIFVIVQHDRITKYEQFSLIYSVKTTDEDSNCDNFGPLDRRVNCFDFVPISFIDNLFLRVRSMLSNLYEFNIQNLWITKEIDYVYESISFDIKPCQDYTNLLAAKIKELYPSNNNQLVKARISVKELLSHEVFTDSDNYDGIIKLSRSLGIYHDAVLKIVLRFFLNTNNDPEIAKMTMEEYDDRVLHDIVLIVTPHANKKKLLHICELNNVGLSRHMSIYSTNLFLQCSKIKYEIPRECKEVMDLVCPHMNLVSVVISDFYLQINYDYKQTGTQAIYIEHHDYLCDVACRIGCQIYNQQKCGNEPIDCSKNSSVCKITLAKFNEGIKDPITKIATKVLEEFDHTLGTQRMKITSVFMNTGSTSDSTASSQDNFQSKVMKHYVNLDIRINEN